MKKIFVCLMMAMAVVGLNSCQNKKACEQECQRECSQEGEHKCEHCKQHEQMNKTDIVLEAIQTRVSVRQFTGEKLSDEQIEKLLRAAMAAPSAMNKQPWQFVVITNEELLAKIGEQMPNSRCQNKPGCAIVPCGDMSKTLEGAGRDFWVDDLSAATENLLLAAHAMGLGACWTGVHPNMERVSDVQKLLGLDEQIVPLCIIPVGVPAEQPEVKQKFNEENVRYIK
ncbi:MAG: nitroreductase family protein [Paludibacteraceae bacterium]|nr:nitroreductase family protein [Paludibacteraceae bacterium]